METYEDLYKTICRVCLSYGNKRNMVCLTDNNSEDGLSSHGKAVVFFANVVINKNDDLPKSMCVNCLKILKHAIYFKLKCESSDKRLCNLYNLHVNTDSNLKETIVDFLMFNQYFPEESSQNPSTKDSDSKLDDSLEDDSNVDNDHTYFSPENSEMPANSESESDSGEDELNALENMVRRTSGIIPDIEEKPLNRGVVKYTLRERELRKKFKLKKVTLPAKKESYVCNLCNKVLANQHTYKYHMERHTGCKFICEHCGKGFPLFVEMNMHQVVRHGTGAFLQCPHCPYRAPRKLNLTEHLRLHTGERPFTCEKCGLTFRRNALYKKHLLHHAEKTVQCPRCPKKFYSTSQLVSHTNSIHERLYMYLCHKCDATYAKTETVRRHLVEKHGIPRELQGRIKRIDKGKGTEFPEQ